MEVFDWAGLLGGSRRRIASTTAKESLRAGSRALRIDTRRSPRRFTQVHFSGTAGLTATSV